MAMRVRLSRLASGSSISSDRRLVHQSTSQGGTLRHAAGKLVRKRSIETIKPHLPQHIVDAPALRPQQTAGFQTKCHILPHRSPRIQRRILKDQNARRIRTVDLLPIHDDVAGTRSLQPRNQAKQGGLAAAARAEQRDEFAGPDGKIDRSSTGSGCP